MDLLRIYYHRDFDGMASAAILAEALSEVRGEDNLDWTGVNFDRTLNWARFGLGERFAVVDFHFHPNAEYWFDHHPTTFLTEEDRARYKEDERHCFDPESPSCPPIILRHAAKHWGWEAPPRMQELTHWSNIIDAARYGTAEQALFGQEPALRVARALTVAPDYDFHDRIVALMRLHDLIQIADDPEISRSADRAERNRDSALESFPSTLVERTATVLFADLRSKRIRRERFAPFYLYPELEYAVTLLPTRAGVHITVASNPWNRPNGGVHLGELMKDYGGGGHHGVGGVNPPNDSTAERWAWEIYRTVAQIEA